MNSLPIADLQFSIARTKDLKAGVQVVHIPSQLGISVSSESSVHRNKLKAITLLTTLLKRRKII